MFIYLISEAKCNIVTARSGELWCANIELSPVSDPSCINTAYMEENELVKEAGGVSNR